MNQNHDTVSYEQLLHVLRRRWWVIAQLLVVGAAVGVALALSSPQRYEATATVLIESGSGDASTGDADQGGLSTAAAARLVRTRGVADRVRRELGDKRSAEDLLGVVSAEADENGTFVNVIARDESASGAARLANAFADQFIAVRAESVGARVQRAIEAGERRLARLPRGSRERSGLSAEVAELRATAVLRGIDAEVIDPAVPGSVQTGGTPLRYGVIGGTLGLLLGLVVAFSLESLDPRVRRLEELRSLVGAPQLAATTALDLRPGRRKKPLVLRARREPFEHLRGALLVRSGEQGLQRIIVTSPTDRKEGKTAVAANLAVSLARLGLRVCAVDADLRQSGLAAHFGLDDTATGLADAIRGAPVQDAIQRFTVPADAGDNGSAPQEPMEINVVAAGSRKEAAAELLAGERTEEVLDGLGRDHEVVILDCAPLLAVSDAFPLLGRASGTILVVRQAHTPRRAVVRAADVVADAQGTMLGIVATGVPKGELVAEGYGPGRSSAPAEPGRVT